MEKTISFFDVDEGKLDVDVLHTFYPLDDDKTVSVECEHIGSIGMISCIDPVTHELDFGKLFCHQVKAIHGVTIKDKNGKVVPTTPQRLVSIADPDFTRIVMATCVHLVTQRDFTELESKN